MYLIWETSRNRVKIFWFNIVPTFHCSNKLLNLLVVISKHLQIQPSASNFKSFSQSVEQSYKTEGETNFGNKMPIFTQNIFSPRWFWVKIIDLLWIGSVLPKGQTTVIIISAWLSTQIWVKWVSQFCRKIGPKRRLKNWRGFANK